MNARLQQGLIILAVFATLAVNSLANSLPLNGLTTGEISDRFDTLFVPAGYTFAIWGLIYLGLLLYAFYQALPAQRENERLRSIVAPFLLASAANIAWIFLWHFLLFPLSLLAMVLLLISLIVIYRRLRSPAAAIPAAERWLVRLPFSIYLGWVSVATIANAQDVLSYWNWDGFGLSEVAWAVTMLIVGLLLALVVAVREQDAAYVLVFVWAYAGIALGQADTPAVATTATLATILLSLVALGLLLLRMGANRLLRRPSPPV